MNIKNIGIISIGVILLGIFYLNSNKSRINSTKFDAELNQQVTFISNIVEIERIDLNKSYSKFRKDKKVFYFLDTKDHKIYTHDLKGKKIASIGGGKGMAPDESVWVYDHKYDSSGVFIVDIQGANLKKISHEGDLISYGKLIDEKGELNRGVALGNNIFLLTKFDELSNQLRVIKLSLRKDSINLIEENILKLPKESSRYDFYYDGDFVTNGNESVYYCWFTNDFVILDNNGRTKFNAKSIFESEGPKVVTKTNVKGHQYTKYKSRYYLNNSAAIDESYFYMLTKLNHGEETEQKQSYIDVYSLKNGDYVGTLKIPAIQATGDLVEYPKEIYKEMDSNDLYVLYEESHLVKYKLEDERFN
ncbi:hypothetical protein [Aureibacter tunicatorum]|uniref:6-bladed beta-propeller n=1 Tax=Aureibacter tunicatorum TaxID=866807 RepID=A0AAE4BV22_9BACT|nr:hypothetical protein [Aureibacter tunicatorum]MDR6241348.1 hypothetical protein [Aureibacter tunicatorum]BDD03607.1 hypothetical protein AUTU_10900 [Aureibacter tunicatorum]